MLGFLKDSPQSRRYKELRIVFPTR